MADPHPSAKLTVLNSAIDYEDGAESELLRIILGARDRSADSDELAAHIHDWPTMYHLSPGRANLLRPFDWDHRMRTLDIGAGSGALTRFLGETGARVDAVEGSLARARVIEARCRDLDNVKIFVGDVSDMGHDERYDVVVVVGVLEYVGRYERQDASAEPFLQRISERLTRDGVLILAIENQLGLKYLAGWKEDHVGVPFIGLEDYLGADGIRTYTRAELARFLAGCGLSKIRWFYPFPDYKLPITILTHGTAADPGLSGFCQQLVGAAAADRDHSASPLYDVEVAMRVWGRAGLLPEVANSFLVVASRAEEALDALTPRGVLAWHFSDPNGLNMWMTTQVIERNENGHIRVRSSARSPQPHPRQGWLSQRQEAERPFVTGTVLRDAIKDAFRTGQVQHVERILRRWRNWLRQEASVSHFQGEPRRNPFAAAFGASVLLPPRFVDVDFGNFVEGDDGNLHYIDAEWEADGGVYLDAVCLRSLWWLAYDLISKRIPLPWSSELRVSELTRILCTLAEIPGENAEVTDEFLSAEAELKNLVFNKGPTRKLDELRAANVHRRAGMEASSTAIGDLARQLADHKTVLADREHQLAEHKAVLADREHQLAEHKAVLADRERQLAEHKAVLADRERQLGEYRTVLADRERQVAENESVLADRVRRFAEHGAALADRERSISAEHRAALADRERQLAEHKAVLADRERQLAEHKVVLADRERQLADHKIVLADRERQLAEHQAILDDRDAQSGETAAFLPTAPVADTGNGMSPARPEEGPQLSLDSPHASADAPSLAAPRPIRDAAAEPAPGPGQRLAASAQPPPVADVTIALLTKNGAKTLRASLGAIGRGSLQPADILAVDSGSTDETLAILQDFSVRQHRIPPAEFSHSRTRNLAAQLATGKYVVFLSQDAEPANQDWLAGLVANLEEDPQVAGVCSRILPRPESNPLISLAVYLDPQAGEERLVASLENPSAYDRLSPLEKRLLTPFHDISSCLRRELLMEMPFPDVQFAEDLAWAHQALRRGLRIVFEPRSQVRHAHAYNPRQIYARTRADARAVRALFHRRNVERLGAVPILVRRRCVQDARYMRALGLPLHVRAGWLWQAFLLHTAEYLGHWVGSRQPDQQER